MTASETQSLLVVLFTDDICKERFYYGFEKNDDEEWNWRKLVLNDYESLTEQEIERLSSDDLLLFYLTYNDDKKSLLVVPETVKVKNIKPSKKPINLTEKNVIIAQVQVGDMIDVDVIYENFLVDKDAVEKEVQMVEVFISEKINIEYIDFILALVGQEVFPEL